MEAAVSSSLDMSLVSECGGVGVWAWGFGGREVGWCVGWGVGENWGELGCILGWRVAD